VEINQDYLNFKNFILNNINFSIDDIEELISFSNINVFKKDHELIKQNEICNEVYFILSGSVKYSILNYKNKQMTFNFSFENSFASAYSIENNNIAKCDITCLEECKVISISIHLIRGFAKNSKKFETLKHLLTQRHLQELFNYVSDILSKKVIDRYNDLEINFPNINQRIPQYLVANYLGITKEHLSRLKRSRYLIKKDRFE
jgi:CRP-like cAMP-binding protein